MQTDVDAVTHLLRAWSDGDPAAPGKLMPLVYDELREIARRYMARERSGHMLQTTALVNEAYMRVARQADVQWANRRHFFKVAAQVMRWLLVDHARNRNRNKRGGGLQHVPLAEPQSVVAEGAVDVLALHQALKRLALFDTRKSQLVELRYFGGLSEEETADILGVSPVTVRREWSKAKAWLYSELQPQVAE